jgi:hypothetical protein
MCCEEINYWNFLNCLDSDNPELPEEREDVLACIDNGSGSLSYGVAIYERERFWFKNGPYGMSSLSPKFVQRRGNAFSIYAWQSIRLASEDFDRIISREEA